MHARVRFSSTAAPHAAWLLAVIGLLWAFVTVHAQDLSAPSLDLSVGLDPDAEGGIDINLAPDDAPPACATPSQLLLPADTIEGGRCGTRVGLETSLSQAGQYVRAEGEATRFLVGTSN